MKKFTKKRKIITSVLGSSVIVGAVVVGSVAQACGTNTIENNENNPAPQPGDNTYVRNNTYDFANWSGNGSALVSLFATTFQIPESVIPTSINADGNPFFWNVNASSSNLFTDQNRWWLNNPRTNTPTTNFGVFSSLNDALGIVPNSTNWTFAIDSDTTEVAPNLQTGITNAYTIFSATMGTFALLNSILRDLYSVSSNIYAGSTSGDNSAVFQRASRWVELFVQNGVYQTALGALTVTQQLIGVRNIILSAFSSMLWVMHYSTLGDLNARPENNETRLDIAEGEEFNPYWYFFDYEDLLNNSVNPPVSYTNSSNMWTFLAEFLPYYILNDSNEDAEFRIQDGTNTPTTPSTLMDVINAEQNIIQPGGVNPFLLTPNPDNGNLSPQEVFTSSNAVGSTPTTVVDLSSTGNFYYRNLALFYNGVNGHSPDQALIDPSIVGSRIEYLRTLPTVSSAITVNILITSSGGGSNLNGFTIDGVTNINSTNLDTSFSQFQLDRYIVATNTEGQLVQFPIVSGFYMNSFLNPLIENDPFGSGSIGVQVPTDYLIISR